MQTEKRFIVVHDSWEYNDEYYYQPEDDPFTLHEPKLYSEDEAKKICAELNEKHKFDNYDYDTEEEYEVLPFRIIELSL